MLSGFLRGLGSYFLFLGAVLRRPESWREYVKSFVRETELLGMSSIPLVVFISLFMGAVLTIQTAINLDDPFIPDMYIGIAVREGIILEFAPTIVSLILAGKVGSNISSSLGTMRVTEQMDALQIMGINPASYLVLPKIGACLLFFPILVVFSIFMGLLGGYLAGDWLHLVNPDSFLLGYFDEFRPYYILYSLTKTTVFAFIISSISAWYGFNVRGGAVEVGKASTQAVVAMSFSIILFNYILTDVMLQ
ncbi:MAG: ABC transporter permease [Cryomorphaceae bacterium]|jgi:phospholipid/cholesterol/gamma-HCH transport system permease protein|nr:ABC transporter permease [Cryomorphaceae bacterium]